MNDVYKKKALYALKEKRAIVALDTLKTLEDIVEKYMTEHAESVSACEVDAFCELKNHINACECVPEKWESTERMGLKEDFCVLVNGCKYRHNFPLQRTGLEQGRSTGAPAPAVRLGGAR